MPCRSILLACLCLPALASSLASAAEKIEVRFLAERVPDGLGKVTLVAEEVRSEPFDLPMNNLSLPQTPPARTFGVLSVDHNRPIASVKLPEQGDSFIALLIPSPKGGYSPVIMRYDDPDFRPGDFYFHNLADKTVLGYVGTSKFILEPRKSTVITPKGARAERFYDVGLGVREKEGDRVLTTTRWPEDKFARSYVFFFVDPVTKRISYRGVDEFVDPVEKKP